MASDKKEYGIKDYAIIGNCETAALVNPDGGIDWLCLPAFDGPSIFGALLDPDRGGRFSIYPAVPFHSDVQYISDTAILRSKFNTPQGSLELIDFFLVARHPKARFYDFTSLYPTKKLVRFLKVTEGKKLSVRIAIEARPDYARSRIFWKPIQSGFACKDVTLFTNIALSQKGEDLYSEFEAEEGKIYFAVLDYSDKPSPPVEEDILKWFEITKSFWEEWNLFNYHKGPHQKIIRRSAVTLKLLTYAPTGAFVAAPTTSLPERIGGDQNWDYRYTWVRDTSLFIDAFFRLGYSGEAKAFFRFIMDCCESGMKDLQNQGRKDQALKVFYPIRPGSATGQQDLDHLAGYRDSRPVRIGNHAEDQLQIDNYAYLLQSLDYYRHTGGRINGEVRRIIRALTREVISNWNKPDNGIWEVLEKAHYTYGKVMAWVALEKVRVLLPHEFKELQEINEQIQREVLKNGIKRSNGRAYLSKSYESEEVDASNLLAYTTGFLPQDLAKSTREEIEKHLRKGPFIYRNPEKKDKQKEGAFLLCTFWWISHLIQENELGRAEKLLSEILDQMSPLGLLSEEIDPDSGEFLGNFPQAFSHLGLINTILNLELAKKKPHFHHLSDKQKFEASVGATIGLKGVISGFIRVPDTARLLFSNQSKWSE